MVGHKSFGRRGEPQRLIPREKAIEAVAQSTQRSSPLDILSTHL
jgi:hypothetical protein